MAEASTSPPRLTNVSTAVPRNMPGNASQITARLIERLTAAWEDGREALAEEILADDPAARDNRDLLFQLIYEEICLRQQAGQESASVRVLHRFPQWRSELELLLDCHRLLEPDRPPVLPEAGQQLGDFRLLAELGRGARGRVFLATQPALADRCVALKVTPREGGEHLSLARLQHAHIVPLYFVQEFPELHLQGLCMPYLGGLSLAAVLHALADSPPPTRSGRQIVDVLDRSRSAAPVVLPSDGPGRRFLARALGSEAVCWLGCCLADALHYAHERGLLHLDVKPSNILLTADGQPMLLDFHLAQAPLSPQGPPPDWVGGTPGYMAPEHEQAVTATREGRSVPVAVDGRADVYSLGIVLYEALGGSMPAPRAAPHRLRRCNPQVSTGLADIIGKCLDPDPARRYPSAAALAADLRCHLSDRPLQTAPNRSLRERWQKWRRRSRPLKFSTLAACLLLGAVAAATWSGFAHVQQRHREANTDLLEGQQQLRRHQHAEAAQTFTRALARLEHDPLGGELIEALTAKLRQTRRGLAADRLHRLTDRLRFLYGNEAVPYAERERLNEPCRTAWATRAVLLDQRPEPFDAAFEERIRLDLLDLAILWADLRVRLAPAGQGEAARREAIQLLQEAVTQLGSSPILDCEQAAYAGKPLDLNTRAQAAPRTAWEHYALGRVLLRRGDPKGAAAEFEAALTRQPGEFWSNFYYGLCCHRLRRHSEALAAFSVCIALAPESPECYYNRALAHTDLGQAESALRDYDQALRLEPRLARAAFNRAVLHLQAQHGKEARADLRRALEGGIDPASIHYHLALVALAENNHEAARTSLEEVLRHNPAYPKARSLYKSLQSHPRAHQDTRTRK